MLWKQWKKGSRKFQIVRHSYSTYKFKYHHMAWRDGTHNFFIYSLSQKKKKKKNIGEFCKQDIKVMRRIWKEADSTQINATQLHSIISIWKGGIALPRGTGALCVFLDSACAPAAEVGGEPPLAGVHVPRLQHVHRRPLRLHHQDAGAAPPLRPPRRRRLPRLSVPEVPSAAS